MQYYRPWFQNQISNDLDALAIFTTMKSTLNTTINRSKNEKNDEHDSQLADIEDEVRQCHFAANGDS